MPYSLGGDLLPEEKGALSEQLGQEEEQKLTADMTEIYDRLLPSAESDDRRQQLVRKLEKLFNDQWPGREIRVHIFGSSGNKLCSSHSDGMYDSMFWGMCADPKISRHLYNYYFEGVGTCVFIG
jgi:DNA polymerase sigma